jgi:choice-of-anchor A domain-containing protein
MKSILRSAAGAVAAAGFLISAAPAFAIPTGTEILNQFNLVVFGDLTSSSEVEGRTYIAGDLGGPSSNYFIKGNEAPPSDYAALIVGGTVSNGPYQVNNGGSVVIGGDLDTQINLNGSGGVRYVAGDVNVAQNGDPSTTVQGPVDIPDFETPLRQLSSDLTGFAANSSATIEGNKGIFTGTPDANGLAVFWIDGVDFFGSIADLEFLIGGADTVIVNVTGAAINIAANFLNGVGDAIAGNVIWNFFEATDLLVTTAFYGSVLAPNADLINTNFMKGGIVANEVIQQGEMHLAPFVGEIPSTEVPEPETALLVLPGLIGLIALGRRFRRQVAAA